MFGGHDMRDWPSDVMLSNVITPAGLVVRWSAARTAAVAAVVHVAGEVSHWFEKWWRDDLHLHLGNI